MTNNNERGAVLIIALAVIGFVGVVGLALLNYAMTNLRSTQAMRPLRGVDFAADGVIDGAINKLALDPIGVPCGADFFRVAPKPLNGQDLHVDCERTVLNDRSPVSVRATFVARCPDPLTRGCGTPGRPVLIAQILFQEQGDNSVMTTKVESWSAT